MASTFTTPGASCDICPACTSPHFSKAFDSTDKDYSISGFSYLSCKDCNSLYLAAQSNFNSQRDATEYHKKFWHSSSGFNFLPSENASFENGINKCKNLSLKIQGYFKKHCPKVETPTLLDIGCGTGYLVSACRAAKIEAFGIEPSANALEEAKKIHNDFFYTGSIENIYDNSLEFIENPSLRRKFDAIVLVDVLEHIWSPETLVNEISKKLLHAHGLLMIHIPIAEDPQFTYLNQYAWTAMAPFHRTLFTNQGIQRLLNNNDFEIVEYQRESLRWGWTRAIAWQTEFAKDHAELRKSSEAFRRYDYEIDKLFNEVFKENHTDIFLVAKKKS